MFHHVSHVIRKENIKVIPDIVQILLNENKYQIVGSVSEGTDFGQNFFLNQRVYRFMV